MVAAWSPVHGLVLMHQAVSLPIEMLQV